MAGRVWRSGDYGRAGSWKDITVIMPGVHATWCRSCVSTSKAQLQLLTNCNTCMYSYVVIIFEILAHSLTLSLSALSWSLRVHFASGGDNCSLYTEAGVFNSSHRLQVR